MPTTHSHPKRTRQFLSLLSLIVRLLLGAGFYWVPKYSRKRKTYAEHCPNPASLLPWVSSAAESHWEALTILVMQFLVMCPSSMTFSICTSCVLCPHQSLSAPWTERTNTELYPQSRWVLGMALSQTQHEALRTSACALPFLKHRLL